MWSRLSDLISYCVRVHAFYPWNNLWVLNYFTEPMIRVWHFILLFFSLKKITGGRKIFLFILFQLFSYSEFFNTTWNFEKKKGFSNHPDSLFWILSIQFYLEFCSDFASSIFHHCCSSVVAVGTLLFIRLLVYKIDFCTLNL